MLRILWQHISICVALKEFNNDCEKIVKFLKNKIHSFSNIITQTEILRYEVEGEIITKNTHDTTCSKLFFSEKC